MSAREATCMKLQVDPVRLKHLRTRIHKPLGDAAKSAQVNEAGLRQWEEEPTELDVETLQRLAKVYGRNWYVFLLTTEEVGKPAIPKDYRRLPSSEQSLSPETLLAFEKASNLLTKIADLPRQEPLRFLERPAISSTDAEAAAQQVRSVLGIRQRDQAAKPGEYDSLQFWIEQIGRFGIYTAQLSFPYREVRAFCMKQRGYDLIVVSSQDDPRPRAFSALHELGHLLLGHDGMCRPSPDQVGAGGEEVFCNRFAAAMLMPAAEFSQDPDVLALKDREVRLGDALAIARKYGVSELAALRRMATIGVIEDDDYFRLHQERDRQMEHRGADAGRRIRQQATRMINENSRLFASEVVDAFNRGDLAFVEVGRLLEGNLKHFAKIREKLAG